jgi:bifunctional DNase/RNase
MKRKKVKILGLSYSQSQVGSYVVVLSESKGNRKIPVVIKPAEAQHIAMKLEGIKSPRPLTHDLMKSFSDSFGIDIQEVYVYSLVEGVFYTKILATNGMEEVELDCSIGDGMALSLAYKCPIWINTDIIESAGINVSDAEVEAEAAEDEEIDEVEEVDAPKKRSVSVEDLEHMMNNAIANEEYEIAAEIRDRIQTLKDANG